MISSKTLNDLQKYNFLLIITAAGLALVGILKFGHLYLAKLLIISILIIFYLFWALFRHFLDKTLNLEIILEYILTAALALVVIYGLVL